MGESVLLAVQVIEGAVPEPMVQSRTGAQHPALAMLAVVTGASLAGLCGSLLAVPLTAAAVGIATQPREGRSHHAAPS